MSDRSNSLTDKLIGQIDQALRTLTPGAANASRANPGRKCEVTDMDSSQCQQSAALMRVNHTGEVCAQALYRGQSLTARLAEVRDSMDCAAAEEIDHLSWCEDRLKELNSRPSLLNPLFYSVSFGLGAIAGMAGDKWSLGFVAETENQVCSHLQDHLERLPTADAKSRAILEQMLEDERHHAVNAEAAGAATLPSPVKRAMTAMARIMKESTARI